MGSIGAKTSPSTRPDEFGGLFGERSGEDALTRLTRVNAENLVNPHYSEDKLYRTNCALCATAVALQARGYDVEALPRDKIWRGFNSVFDVDYADKDNYILPAGKEWYTGQPRVNQFGNIVYTPENATQATIVTNPPRMPKGANAVANAVENKVLGWGNGAVGTLHVSWKGRRSAHVINVINQNGTVVYYDGQSNTVISDIRAYLKRTTASQSSLIRLDNAKVRSSIKDLDKMVKRRSK